METNQLPLVSIQCLVYNHEPYLRQCLEGFVMQKTSFKFEAIVHDDVSTDGSAAIIREYAEKYPEIIKPIYEIENQYSKNDGSLEKIMNEACKGKYIALCEGDDYWSDPLKLEKQIKHLESSKEYGLCYSKANIYNQIKNVFEDYTIGREAVNPIDEIMNNGNFIPTQTIVCRKDLVLQYIKEIRPHEKHWLMGDLPLLIWFTINSKIKFINETTAVYRVLENSASHSNDLYKQERFFTSSKDIRLFYINQYSKYKHYAIGINNLYYRTLLNLGEKHKNRKYCLEKLKYIKKKNLSEIIKRIIYMVPTSLILLSYYKMIRNKFTRIL